MNNRIFTF